ncbi:MAG: tRNA lysidine(34) synthetase TilS [Chloroflexota bacterium]|nr:tRNA lysidine(34) synthetase TilS [Chloroflexota bacterium]
MLEHVTAYIEQYRLLPESGEVLVAVSGGADSLCLLHLLRRLCGPEPGKRYAGVSLRVAHLNHKLRALESAREAEVVAQLARAWGLPVIIGEEDVPALALRERRSLEDAAREARYRFLRTSARGQHIAVAHHADDQVETLLLHWLRGGGLAGMVGMAPHQQDIVRPLLQVTHAETVAYCRAHGIVPLEDASNADPRFTRNRIRHELLPLLASLNPGIRETLLRNAEVLRSDLAWIEAQVDACLPTVLFLEQDDIIALHLDALKALPLSIQRHLLRRVSARLSGGQSGLELRHYALIEQLVSRPFTPADGIGLDLPRGLRVVRHVDRLIFTVGTRLIAPTPVGQESAAQASRAQEDRGQENAARGDRAQASGAPTRNAGDLDEVMLPVPGQVGVPGTRWRARAEPLPLELEVEVRRALTRQDWDAVWRLLPATRLAVYVDGDAASTPLRVRTRRPGDRLRPLGMTGEKKVQDLLVDKHIPRAERGSIPLFFSAAHCLWVAGLCLDDRVRLTATTQRVVRLSVEYFA